MTVAICVSSYDDKENAPDDDGMVQLMYWLYCDFSKPN